MASPFRRFYDYLIRQTEGPNASIFLAIIAFAESSFFPIPPDIMLLPMALAQRAKAYRYALICTVSSVIGGLLGYSIGAFFIDTAGQWIIAAYHLETAFQHFHDQFNEWGVWIILAKGLTPIPFKLVTIASGVAHLNLVAFLLAAIATRGVRFYLVAFLAKRFGEPIRAFVEKYLTWVMLGLLVIIVFGFWLVLG
jgi:membrane protein YqaA with SNARE-associated domain